jgi:short-subunit dehydrogenase
MNILITGSTSGLGEAIYEGLLLNSKHSFFNISKNKRKINIQKKNKKTFGYICDFSSKNKIDKILKKIHKDSYGKIDIIICNAASGSIGTFEKIPINDYDKKITTNFISHLKIIKKFYENMKKRNPKSL